MKDLPTISLQEIMRGNGMKHVALPEEHMLKRKGMRKTKVKPAKHTMLGMGEEEELLSNQPSTMLETPFFGEIEGGKISMRKVKRGYKKHVRPVVSAVVRTAAPIVKKATAQALNDALISASVPPPLATVISRAVAEEGINQVIQASNESGVTKGAGLVVLPGSKRQMLGTGLTSSEDLPVQMLSTNQAAFNAARFNLVKEVSNPEVKPFVTESLPVQMQSNPQFNNMQLITGVAAGRGLYMGGHGQGLYMGSGRGLY